MNNLCKILMFSFLLIFMSSCSFNKNNNSNTGFGTLSDVSFVLNQFDNNNLSETDTKSVENEIQNNPEWINFLSSNNDTISDTKQTNQNQGFYGSKLNWKKRVNKSEFLSYLKANNLSVANLSDIELENDENSNTKNIKITNKNIDAKDFVKKFKFLSNRLIEIKSTQEDIEFSGNGFGLDPQKELIFE